jgi:hypothetical protein
VLTPPRLALLLTFLLPLAAGCASIPKESVELSVTVGRDLAALHVAHVALVKQYFDRMEADVNAFVDTQYRPYSIDRNMKDFDLVGRITAPRAKGGPDALEVMQVFVEELTADIEDQRRTLLAPIRAQRQEVLGALEEAYRRLQDAQAVLTAHLASVRKVREAQDEALAAVGLKDLQARVIDATAALSERIAGAVARARYSRDKLAEFERLLETLRGAAPKNEGGGKPHGR